MTQQFRISAKGIALVQEFEGDSEGKLEGDRWQAYLDTIAKPHVWTVYYGLTNGVHEGTIVTREQGDEMMKREFIQCETALESMVDVPLNPNMQDALLSLVFNIGPGSPSDTKNKRGFYWSTMRKLINQGKLAAAAAQFERYNHAGGVAVKGLTRRREREAALFMEPMPDAEDKALPMPQRVDVPSPAVTVTQAVRSSPTIGAASVGLLAGIGKAGSSVWDWITDAGQQIGAAKEASGQFGELFKALHINMETVCLTIIVGSLSFVILRHIGQKREGTSL
jgi:lysozyme